MRRIPIISTLFVAACGGVYPPAFDAIDSSLFANLSQAGGVPLDLAEVLAQDGLVVLAFWQPGSSECHEVVPKLVNAQRDFEQISVIGVVSGSDLDVDEVAMRRTIAELGMNYPSVSDRDASLARAFDVDQAPTIIVLDRDRRVRFRGYAAPQGGWKSVLDL